MSYTLKNHSMSKHHLWTRKRKKKEVYSVLTIALILRRTRLRKNDNEAYLEIETKCVNNIIFVRVIQQILEISVECNGISQGVCSQWLYTDAFSIRCFGLNVFFAEPVAICMTLAKHWKTVLSFIRGSEINNQWREGEFRLISKHQGVTNVFCMWLYNTDKKYI